MDITGEHRAVPSPLAQPAPAPAPATARSVFEALYRIVFDLVLVERAPSPGIARAIEALPAAMQETARALLTRCGIDTETGDAAALSHLPIVLNEALRLPAFIDDEEAVLASGPRGTIGTVTGQFFWSFEKARLVKAVGLAVQA